MNTTTRIEEIMSGFSKRTGLVTDVPPRRYLWTDAFAVCNYLELFRRTGKKSYLDLAIRLVDQVHHVLGRHRRDDSREGWISGLNEQEGERHPTRGGLRIGKENPERLPQERFDEQAEWNRDGQYYHYLTKWMHALDRVARVSGMTQYRQWAIELARAVYGAFLYTPHSRGKRRMYWKISIDLSRPLIPSMGQHDPLDGLITYQQLQSAVHGSEHDQGEEDLIREIEEMASLCEGVSWKTIDALGIGGLLFDACRLAQLVVRSAPDQSELLTTITEDAAASLEVWELHRPLDRPIASRLAFRELGLSIGLRAIERIERLLDGHPQRFSDRKVLERSLRKCARFRPLVGTIESLWQKADSQRSAGWRAHLEINNVMLATSLGPDGFLRLD